MYDLRGCRACLNHDCKLERINETTKRLYCSVTGLDFTSGEYYPSYFCTECSSQIRKILSFRRRCRRAVFVLKEILAVRKRVTLADLASVDRKKTNLKSNVGYWRNNNTGFYSVIKTTEEEEEANDKPSDIREFIKEFEPTCQDNIKPNNANDITKYTPEVINNTFVAIDIKPNNCENANEEDERNVEYLSDCGIDVNDDIYENDERDQADVNVAEIDLTDVFKDLPEENSEDESNYGLSEPELPQVKPEKIVKRKRKDKQTILQNKKDPKTDTKSRGMTIFKSAMLSQALMSFTVKLLSFEEQIDTFQARKELEPYKSAGFKCAICLIVFEDMCELLKNVVVHNKKHKQLSPSQRKKYQCVICKDLFGNQEELTAHSACFHWYKYSCNECNEDKYTLFDVLKCHSRPKVSDSRNQKIMELFKMADMSVLEPPVPINNTCQYCRWWVHKSQMDAHERIHVEEPSLSNRNSSYQCDMCGIYCRVKAQLEDHMMTHYKEFTCRVCNQVLEGWNAAHAHLKEHKRLKCRNCDETFTNDIDRRKHKALVHTSSNAPFDCILCGLPVENLNRLYNHQLRQHGYISINDPSLGDPQYRCEMCGIHFVDEASLRTHMEKKGHVEASKLGGKCESCQKIFLSVEDFMAHRRGNKSCKRYPVKCVYCDEMLQNYHMSERHYAQAHPAQPNEHQNAMLYAICEFCGKAIAEYHIKAHTKKHTTPGGEPKLKCTMCSAKMFTSRAYVSHILFNHTPKPYMCALCPYRVKYRSECRDHILKVHAPELLYSCQRCTRRFSHLDLLQQHSVKAHRVSVKDDRSVYLPAKDVMGKIFVFPHMKIDSSFIPPALIEDAGLFLYDYLCKSQQLVDWRDYCVFNTGVEPVLADPYVHRKRGYRRKPNRPKRKRKPVSEDIVKAIENLSYNLEAASPVKEIKAKKRKRKVRDDAERENVKVIKLEEEYKNYYDFSNGGYKSEGEIGGAEEIEEKDEEKFQECEVIEDEVIDQVYDMPDLEAEILGEPSKVDEDDTNVEEIVEDAYEADTVNMLSENYEVFEQDGEQYVFMNGKLYRLQTEDD